MRLRILVRTCHLVPRRRRLAQLLQIASAVVPLDDWLPPSLISAWNHPDCVVSGGPVAPRFFDVNMAEWKALCRRMLRSGLGRKFIQRHVLLVSLVEHLPFHKDLDRDRFIGDLRPRNGTERLIGKNHLPWAPRLRRLMPPSNCVIRIHFRDVSDCYYAYSVDEERFQRQVLGPRVPVCWFP